MVAKPDYFLNQIMKIILKFILIVGFLYVIICVFLFSIQKSFIFFPSKEIFSIPKDGNLADVYIKTEDNIKLNAWFLDNKSDKTVIFFHGNGGNIFYIQERLKIFNELHLNVILFDYRGYGKSEGKIHKEEDLYKDSNAIYNYVISRGTNTKNIILWGQSLGGAVAINLAQNKNIYATIIESTFYSMDEMARTQYWFLPTRLLLKFHFINNEKISNINSPILIIHSNNDEIVNFSYGKRLFDKAKNPKMFLETKGSHNGGFEESYSLYISALKTFLKINKE